MKNTKILLLLACLPLLSSCKLVSYYSYDHKPTQSIKDCLWNTAYEKDKCLKGKDLVIIPDFRAFTPSFPRPSSRLIVCSKGNDPIWISKAILRVPSETNSETTLNLSKEYPHRQRMGKTEYGVVWVLLFDQKNCDYSKYEMKEKLELEIEYAPAKSEPLKTETFELNLIKKRDIAWPT